MPSSTTSAKTLADLTEAQRKTLAQKIIKEREGGRSWDGEDGICNDARFPLVKSAGQGRKLLREAGKTALIAKSYDRNAAGLVGPRTADAKPKAKPAAKKAAPRKTAAKAK